MKKGYVAAGAALALIALMTSLYHLHFFFAREAAVSMLQLSNDLRYGEGMLPIPPPKHSLFNVDTEPPLNDTLSPLTKKRIAVVMAIHQDTALYRASVQNHRRYCQLHGYHFMTQEKELLPEAPFRQIRGHEYQKAAVLMEALLIGIESGEFDWILWTDLDTIIVNPTIPLEALLPPSSTSQKHPPYFIGNQDHNGFNAGVFFLRVVPWSVQLMAMVLADPYHIHNDLMKNAPGASAVDITHVDDDDKTAEHQPRFPSGMLSERAVDADLNLLRAPTLPKPPTLNDQASFSRIFQGYPSFAQHFQQIPYGWMNVYPPREYDTTLDTSVPRIAPTHVEEWVKQMEQAAVSAREDRDPSRFKPQQVPMPMSPDQLKDLKELVRHPTDVVPAVFRETLQVHLVNYRKWEFNFASILAFNSKITQIGVIALVIAAHEAMENDGLLPKFSDGGSVSDEVRKKVIRIWENEKETKVCGMKIIEDKGLYGRRDNWYAGSKTGIEGMRWLDG